MRNAINSKTAVKPAGAYSHAVREGGLVFISGQGPTDPVTGKYQPADIATETRNALANIKGILESTGSSVEKVVKVNVYLRDIDDAPVMNAEFAKFFSPPYPARTTLQAVLARGMGVVVDCVARE